MLFSANEVLLLGLKIAKINEVEQQRLGQPTCREIFGSMYGSPPHACAQIWQELCNTDVEDARIPDGQQNEKGFKMFMMAQFMLWVYPKNRRILQVMFHPVGEKNTYGTQLWTWIARIAAMITEKIKWQDRFDDPDAEVFLVTVDGVDCRTWEKRDHPTMPFDKKLHSHKFKHASLKYEIAVAIYSDHIVWVNGPFRGGKHDLTILREGQEDNSGSLLERIPEGKFMITDRGYRTGSVEEMKKIAYKRNDDPIQLKRHKGRATCRHETVNARIKQFQAVAETFRHGKDKHEMAFKAICVIVQYHLDLGVAMLYNI